ncbi:MAG TPA: DUF3631 domain-containing protein [Candidatus Angelobacter sp.]
MLGQTLTVPPELAAPDTSFNPDELEPIDGAGLLEQVSQFIGRYLQCSDHQRTVLALWVLHTHCSTAAQVTPYLSIQSAQKQSGKTLCLQLLNLLCDFPALTAGFTANTLTRRIDGPVSTILLDECQATVGTRARSKGPALRAILAGGYHCGIGYTDATHERNAFSPKAFAGMGQLPEALADRSISIILEPLESGPLPPSAAKPAKPKVRRFDLSRAFKEAKPLQTQLHFWAEENLPDLEEKPVYSEDFPPNLSPRRCDMIEPLLQLADFIGGHWPVHIREALAGIFAAETEFELRHSLQLLADVRDCFAHNAYPERLSTADLLAWLHTLPTRPWDMNEAGPITARIFARLLLAFDIHPRVQRIGSAHPARGYQLQDFIGPWQIHLGFNAPGALSRVEASPVSSDSVPCSLSPVHCPLFPGLMLQIAAHPKSPTKTRIVTLLRILM